MSATDQGAAATPLLIVDVEDLAAHIRALIADPEVGGGSYTDIFSGKKTDIAPTPGGAITASRVILNTDIHAVLGWAFAETTGTAGATIRLWDGANASGECFGRINLIANESVRDWYIPRGIRVSTGRLFVQVVSGSVEGVVYWL